MNVTFRDVARQFRGCAQRHILVGTIIATNVKQKNQLRHCRMCRTLALILFKLGNGMGYHISSN